MNMLNANIAIKKQNHAELTVPNLRNKKLLILLPQCNIAYSTLRNG
jgi:hypothetical protein